ncbi:MAG: hypothetical protein ACJ762_16695 [Solirubrobacteraceae bacterium]
MRRRVALLAALALAGCGASRPTAQHELAVERADLRPGTIELVVANGTDEPATLAQVAVDSGFVPYDGPVLTIGPHETSRLAVPYPWIAGQGYSVKVLTGNGEALEYRVET